VQLRDLLPGHGILAQRTTVALLALHVLGQYLEALLDRREREHRKALEIERLRDVLEAVIQLADHVVITDEHVVEIDGVGDLVADRGNRLDLQARMIHRHQKERDAVMLLGGGIGASADPVPLREVGRRRPDLLAVEHPAPARFVAGRLELHGSRIGAGLRLAVADRELDVVLQDLGKEFALQLLAGVTDERLADDAHSLADLGGAAPGEALVEQELVDPLPLASAVLLGPRHAEPTAMPHFLHEGATRRSVDDLGHVLAANVHDLGPIVLVEKLLHLLDERPLLFGELEIHRRFLQPDRADHADREGGDDFR
jgi:hypothetical protein